MRKTIEGFAEKLKIHGFSERSRKFLELVDNYSNTSEHTQVRLDLGPVAYVIPIHNTIQVLTSLKVGLIFIWLKYF